MVKSILVVGESSRARSTLIARLENDGYLVVSARAREEAREILDGLVPGAVFLDLTMPGRQGRLLMDDLERRPQLRMIPRVVALGAWRRSTRPVAAAATFVKPLDLDHVIRTLRSVYPPASPAIVPLVPRRRPPLLDEPLEAMLAS
jgi:CheY-like chemotaxis protein